MKIEVNINMQKSDEICIKFNEIEENTNQKNTYELRGKYEEI